MEENVLWIILYFLFPPAWILGIVGCLGDNANKAAKTSFWIWLIWTLAIAWAGTRGHHFG